MNVFHRVCHLAKLHVLIISALLIIPQKGLCLGLFDIGASFNVASPQGEFKDNVDRNGYGISGIALFSPIPLLPLKLGLELGYVNYGSEERRESFSYTIPDVKVKVQRNNNIFLGHLLLRVQQDVGILSPYVDGLFGLNYLWTDTKIREVEYFEEIASSKNFDDLTSSYGVGCGIMFKAYDAGVSAVNLMQIYVDLKVRYLYSGEAEYLKEGAISIDENAKVHYDVSKSKTDLMLFQLGFIFSF